MGSYSFLSSDCLESENLREMDDEYSKLIRRMNPPRFFFHLSHSQHHKFGFRDFVFRLLLVI